MNLRTWIVGMIVVGSIPVFAVDSWKPRPKDEFEAYFEEKVYGKSRPESVEEVEFKNEVVPEVQVQPEEPKPEVKTYKNLKLTPVKLQDGGAIKFENVVIFSCENISKKRFLFNKKQSDYCWIKDVKDAAKIAEKIGVEQFKKKASVFEICPEKAITQNSCDPKRLRNF